MSRTVRISFGVILIVVIATTLLLTLAVSNINPLVERVIESAGTEAAGVEVSVDSVQITLKEGSGIISGLTIANPPGFTSKYALNVGTAAIAIDIESLTNDIIIINSVQIDSPSINYEQSANNSNLQTILDTLSTQDSTASVDEPGDSDSSIRIIIRKFDFTGANAVLAVPALDKSQSVTLPDIHLRDIGANSQGASARELVKQILQPIIRKTLAAALNVPRDELERKLNEKADKALDRGKEKAQKLLDKLGR